MLSQIQPGLATPLAGVRWLTEVEWTEPYTGPIPQLAVTAAIPIVADAAPDEAAALAEEPRGPVGSIWDALDETQGLPLLSRAALWRRDAVERRTAQVDEQGDEPRELSA